MFGRKKENNEKKSDKDVIFTNLIDHEKRIKELEQMVSEIPKQEKNILVWTTTRFSKDMDGFVHGKEQLPENIIKKRIKELEEEYKKDNFQYKIAD